VTAQGVNTRQPLPQLAPPLPNTYWVEQGRLLAGEYPGSPSRADTLERLHRLLAAGVTYFFDLTEPGELTPYDPFLPHESRPDRSPVFYTRRPLPDHDVPGAPEIMVEILDHLERALAAGHCVYVHCRAGVGRTGTVLGCYFVHRGMEPAAALAHLNELWRANARSRSWPSTPETEDQVEYVRNWRGPGASAASAASAVNAVPAEDMAAARALRERFRGALVGLAVGDALGAAVQHRKPGSFTPVNDLLGGGPFELPRGAWTDDTAMALCLAESLTACGGFDPADQVERYQRWQHEGHLTSTGECVGITAGVSRALATARWSGKAFAGSHDPTQLDKETLSRVAPAVLFFLSEPREAIHYAAEAARTTQQSPVVLDACRYLAALLVGALGGTTRQQLLAPHFSPVPDLWEGRGLKQPVAAIADGAYRAKPAEEIDGGGTVVQALEAVLWALDRTTNFRDGALLAVNLGLDADVTGAVYGQLAGALYGLNGIPAHWRTALQKRELIEDFADRLLACALQRMAG
jgi:ADP-ribosylglycohydrolase/protein-tyrosine phosphatase